MLDIRNTLNFIAICSRETLSLTVVLFLMMSRSANGNSGSSVGQDQVLILLEEIARSNQKLSAENSLLAQEMKKRDEANMKAVKDIQDKLDKVCGSDGSQQRTKGKGRKAQRVCVPAECRVSKYCLSDKGPTLETLADLSNLSRIL